MKNKKDDTFLARWLNGDLSPEELHEFEQSKEFEDYRKIAMASGQIQSEDFDTEALLARIKSKTSGEKGPKHSANVIRLWPYGIAAAIALLAAFFIFYNPATIIKTGYGEQQSVVFPDGSSATVNAKSVLSFKDGNWSERRVIDLEGEAYFEVEKGAEFSVMTNIGDVTVLGTAFNVRVSDGFFQVTCYEGKVKVEANEIEQILTPGDHFQWIDGEISTAVSKASTPQWMHGQSTFEAVPIVHVLDALSDQFNLTFQYDELEKNLLYTGSFPHNDKDLALQVVLGALEIDYEIKDDVRVVLKK